MRLIELNPILKGTIIEGQLIHDCPVCKSKVGFGHKVVTYISDKPFHEVSLYPQVFWDNGTEKKKKIWQATGEFPDTISLHPSINIVECDPKTGAVIRTLCWHGFITNGEVT